MRKIIGLLICLLCVGCSSEKSLDGLTIGVMPSLDSAPILWAYEKGYFEEAGLDVTLIQYSNAVDRDTQVQTKAVDVVVTDLMGLLSMREAGYDVQGLSATQTLFSLVSKDLSPDPLTVAMAEVSVTQYGADLGLTQFNIEKQFIDAVPQRLEMVGQGLVDGAILPEPMASMAVVNGMTRTVLEFDSPNLLMWQSDAIDRNAVDAFYDAYNRAVDALMKDEAGLKDLLVTSMALDPAIKDAMIFPEYTHAMPIDESVYNSIVSWMASTLNMTTTQTFESSVNNDWVQ